MAPMRIAANQSFMILSLLSVCVARLPTRIYRSAVSKRLASVLISTMFSGVFANMWKCVFVARFALKLIAVFQRLVVGNAFGRPTNQNLDIQTGAT
eukprot:2567347-Amphidinium_carterae.1